MRKLFFLLPAFLCLNATAQKNTADNIIEGGRVLADILRVFKTPKNNLVQTPVPTAQITADSCQLKALSDCCFKNTSGKSLYIALYKRNGNIYTTVPLNLLIPDNTKECLLDIPAGIYKYKIEYEAEDKRRILFREGEFKLDACGKKLEEIKK